jgi:hypothetical protein
MSPLAVSVNVCLGGVVCAVMYSVYVHFLAVEPYMVYNFEQLLAALALHTCVP